MSESQILSVAKTDRKYFNIITNEEALKLQLNIFPKSNY